MKKTIYLIFFLATTLQAQVTIGSLENPVEGSILQLKSIDDITSGGGKNCDKGIGFPRVELVKSSLLMPMYSETDAKALSDDQKRAHKGLVVYNVAENDAENFEPGIYVWGGAEWQLLGGKTRQAKIANIDCDHIILNGTYVKGTPLNPLTNTMILEIINVEREGSYDIRVEALKGDGSMESNGYIFSAQGEFTTSGLTLVKLEGQGTPQFAYNDYGETEYFDIFRIYVNGKLFSCDQTSDQYVRPQLTNKVLNVEPKFTFTCSSIRPSVNLAVKKPVEVTDVITLRVTSDVAEGEYHIYTDEINGVKFEARGTLVTGTQQVILYASGTPKAGGTHDYIIYSNSVKANSQCDVSITVTYPRFTIQVYGNSSGEWGLYNSNSTLTKLVANAALFGLGSNQDAPIQVNSIVLNGTSADDVATIPAGTDMVFISYNCRPNPTMVTALSDFVEAGGFLIYSVEYRPSLLNIAKAFDDTFKDNYIPDVAETSPNLMPLALGNHLANGLYQNLEGKNVGRDGAGNYYFEVGNDKWTPIIKTTGNKARGILCKNKPVLLIGDGGFFSGGTPSFSSSTDYHPCRVDNSGNPIPAVSSNTWTNPGAYNSAFMVNLIMWAIEARNNK